MTQQINLTDLDKIREHISKNVPTLYTGSKTSLVIPFEQLDLETKLDKTKIIANLSTIKPKIKFIGENKSIVEISGAVTWKDLKSFCLEHDRQVMTSPTEELACVLSGIATSATGERCFGLGALRDQIEEVHFLNYKGEKIILKSEVLLKALDLNLTDEQLFKYQEDYSFYKNYKNAPFPRFEKQTDLMTGTEGQLGVITSAKIKTFPNHNVTYLFLKLGKWEEDFRAHLEFFKKVQEFRGDILSCEFLDHNSLSYLKKEERPVEENDLIFIEVISDKFEYIYENLISKLELISENDFFEVSRKECQTLRVSVPRAIFEDNDRRGVIKKASDVQMIGNDFEKLLVFYKELSNQNISYNLFGHFGDGHLHFNFMPTKKEVKKTNKLLDQLYENVRDWKGSPFAEHGIGVVKKQYIQHFYSSVQIDAFKALKSKYDPNNIFFPEGFLNVI